MRQLKSIKVSSDLISLTNEDYAWQSTGDNPQFFMGGSLPTRGWNMLEFSLEHNISSATARFYFDTGHGFREEDSIVLPLRASRIVKRLCYLPATLKAVRIDPLGSKGKFTIHHFRFIKIIPWVAHKQLIQRLVNMHHFYRGQKKGAVIREIKSEAKVANMHWRHLALQRYDETYEKRCSKHNYSEWIEQTEKPLQLNDTIVEKILGSLSFKPIISILLPTYNDDVGFIKECIESVRQQSYTYWQLCISCDTSSLDDVKILLEKYASLDERIKVKFHKLSGYVAEISNDALTLVTGEYTGLLDKHDLLSRHALLKMAQALNDTPEAGILYSDEDSIDVEGKRFNPHFKPEWNPDLLLSCNYISHLVVYKTQLVRAVGGYRKDVEGSQNYDLLLRCVSQLQAGQIVHIPEVLYHHRKLDRPVKKYSEEKNGAANTDVKVLSNYFEHCLSRQRIEIKPGLLPDTYRIHWPIPQDKPLVSILIPTRDGYKILKRCIDSILEKTTYNNYEILILNNQSSCSETLQYLKAISKNNRVTVYDWNYAFNYSAINNFGVSKCNGSILGLMNNDVEVINSDWLDEIVSHSCRQEIGCVGAKLYYDNETVQHGGVILGVGGVAGHAHKYFSRNEHGYFSRLKVVQNLSAVTGACLFVRKAIFEQVDGLDENLVVAFNDVDLCLKVREAGFRNLWTPYAELYHHESLTRGADNTNKKRARARREASYMRKRWGRKLDTDPAYNPNLTLIYEDFSLK